MGEMSRVALTKPADYFHANRIESGSAWFFKNVRALASQNITKRRVD